jgi:hypothetical protein
VAPRRLRLLEGDVAGLPDWWPRSVVADVFDLVSGRPDVSVLPMPDGTWTEQDLDRAATRATEADLPTAAYYPFDSWDDPSRGWRGRREWADALHRYYRTATVVAGPQLPLTGGPTHCVPLPYGPLVPRVPEPPVLAQSSTDVHFAGFYLEPGWAAPPLDTRDRHHRGHLVQRLTNALPADRLVVRKVEYWGVDDEEKARMRSCAVAEMDRSTMVLAPAGYGYLTFRHSDAWARGRALLSEPVQRHVLVPEPERWEDGDLAVLYHPATDDIADVVTTALGQPERLAAVARAGWEYGRRWTRPEAQVALLAEALASHLVTGRGSQEADCRPCTSDC